MQARQPRRPNRFAAYGASAALLALVMLGIAWEWRLAPLRPGGSALVLKAVPLLLALPGVWRRRLYTLQWASMLSLLYFAEGIVRGWSDRGLSARLGWLQAALALIFFICALSYVAPFKRAAKRAAKAAAKRGTQDFAGLRDEPPAEAPGRERTETPGRASTGAHAEAPAQEPAEAPARTPERASAEAPDTAPSNSRP